MRWIVCLVLLGCSSEPSTNDGGTTTDSGTQSDTSSQSDSMMTACNAGQIRCNGTCVDTKTDPNNCGGCGSACMGANMVCGNGMCSTMCPMGTTQCGKSCVDLKSDDANCSMCGNACPMNAPKCISGVCCAMGQSVCNNACTDTMTDSNNCGMCGMKCPQNMPACTGGKCMGLYTFQGPKTNLPDSMLSGYTECFKEVYSASGSSVANKVLTQCKGNTLIMACRKVNTQTLIVAAMGARSDVTFNTGSGNVGHTANGVVWYYDAQSSWGFARAGDPLDRLDGDGNPQCDTSSGTNPADRLCWHVGSGQLTPGWRCGATQNLNASNVYERVVYSSP